MKIKASGRWALMLATGLIVCFAGPLPAKAASSDPAASKSDTETSRKSVRQSSRHSKHTADRTSSKTADKPAETKKAADAGNNAPPAVIPASVANANAELPTSDTAAADNASAKANTILAAADNKPVGQADADVVASDQLNDVDRALQQETPADTAPQPQQQAQLQVQTQPQQPSTVAMASARPVLASADNSTWDQTSLIGKVFIAFGALLTVASAARMFMA